jgi:pimeloyl-ACP methyl ester carboxylesterase
MEQQSSGFVLGYARSTTRRTTANAWAGTTPEEVFAQHRAYLQQHQPPTLIVWGSQDHYMPEQSARAYLRDLPDAELHLLDGGHWLLETNLDEVVVIVRSFLARLRDAE